MTAQQEQVWSVSVGQAAGVAHEDRHSAVVSGTVWNRRSFTTDSDVHLGCSVVAMQGGVVTSTSLEEVRDYITQKLG